MRQGICIPIGFYCQYRGRKYKEVNLYFSNVPIKFEEDMNMLHPDKTKDADVQHLKNKISQNYDFLLPYKVFPAGGFEIKAGKKYSIGSIDDNPTTATLFSKIALMPCLKNNFQTMIELLEEPPFYIGKREDSFYLYIKGSHEGYVEIPQQKQAIATWDDVAHSQITFNKGGCPDKYENIDWQTLLDELRQV